MEPFKRATTKALPASHDGTPHKATERSIHYSSNREGGNKPVKFSMDDVYDHLKIEIGPFRHLNLDVGLFAEHVWGLAQRDVAKLLNGSYKLDKSKLANYAIIKREKDLHQPFLEFTQVLLSSAALRLGRKLKGVRKTTVWDGKGDKILKQDGRVRKPDLLGLFHPGVPDTATPKWNNVTVIFEFKKNFQEDRKETEELDANNKGKAREKGMEKEKTKASKKNTTREARSMPILYNEPSTSSAGTKRKNSDEPEGSKRKKACTNASAADGQGQDEPAMIAADKIVPELSSALRQVASYALETMAATSRFWTVGLLIDRFNITVCYFDRFLAMSTTSFNFKDEPQKLALIIYAINCASPSQYGFDPLLRPWSSLTDKREITKKMKSQLNKPVDPIIGSYIELPDSSNVESVADSIATSTIAENAGGSNQLTKRTASKGESSSTTVRRPLSFLIEQVLRRPDDVVGRGTMVLRVRRKLPDGSLSNESYAYKQNWPVGKRVSEVDFIQHLRRNLPADALKHLPEVIFTTTSSSEELGLPWKGMGLTLTDKNHQERVLRRIVFKSYKTLWEAGSLANFKQAWLDCVEIHHLAYSQGKVFHRDIHELNLMFTMCDGVAVGVLNDWDMAKFIGAQDDGLTGALHRTGSLPFLALDLVEGGTVHWYRHELEGFFYVLLWGSVHYNLAKKTRDSQAHAALVKWVGTRDENASSKKDILSYSQRVYETIIKDVKAEFKPLIVEWLTPLRTFLAGELSEYEREVFRNERTKGDEEDTCGGRITFKKFLKAIGKTPRDFGDKNYAEFLDREN